jgi:hypothetical protein
VKLALFLHCDQALVDRLYTLPDGWSRKAFLLPGLSSPYRQLARDLRRRSPAKSSPPPFLPALLQRLGVAPLDMWERIAIVSHSAGWALVEELFATPIDRSRIDGWIALDSGYGSVDPGVVRYARSAAERRAVLWSGVTDVPTYGYASSLAYAREILKRAAGFDGDAPDGLVHEAGWLRVERHAHDPAALHHARDVGAFWRAEHSASLTEWGPSLVAGALALLDGKPEVAEEITPTTPRNA